MPEGDYALVLRVADAAQDTPLDLYNGWFRRGDNYTLLQVHVVGRKHSFVVPNISHPQVANFEGRISMMGYAFGSTTLHGGDSLHLTLYWQGQSVMSTSYKFFVHIVDGQGHLLAQHDDIPGGEASPTTGWLPREVVTDSFDLPVPGDSSPGTYQIQAGFYDAVTGERLNVLDATGVATNDYVVLQDSLEVTNK